MTVAIPTFNRAMRVRERICELLPQVTPEIALIVFDNGSTDETPAYFAGEFAAAPVAYRRSSANLGMMRNFMRCFEETDGDWLWILGDDDPVRPDALAQILALTSHPTAGVILTTTNCNLNIEERLFADLDEYFQRKDVTSLCHVSANLYRRAAIAPHFGCLAPSAFTVVNIAIIALRMLDAGTAPLLITRTSLLVDRENPRRWSVHEVALGLSLAPEFFSRPEHQRAAALGLWQGTRWMLMWALMEVRDDASARRWRRLCRQVDGNLKAYGSSLPAACHTFWRSSSTDVRRGLLLQIFSALPVQMLRYLSLRLGRRTGGDETPALAEFTPPNTL